MNCAAVTYMPDIPSALSGGVVAASVREENAH
jgi:hypothetical protein